MSFTVEQAAEISENLLSAAEIFAPNWAAFDDHKLEFGEIVAGEQATVRMRECTIAGERFLMVAKRVGG